MSTIAQEHVEVTGGVDTHKHTHTAAVIDAAGRMLGSAQFPAEQTGYEALLAWMQTFGQPVRIGVEGSSSYGAGLAVFLRGHAVTVVEVDRPDRKMRRRRGKSDPVDAEAAARATLSARAAGVPKSHDGQVEALRNLRIARSSAVQQRADVQRQIHTLVVTAPEHLRGQLRGLNVRDLVATCAATPLDLDRINDPAMAAAASLRFLARRHQHLSAEIAELDAILGPLVAAISPELLARKGVGTEVAGQLLVTAGDNPGRLHSEAAFAMLCGAAPLPASSGITNRHRLNRGGDRQANRALWTIVISRLRWDQRTRAYVERRTRDGLSKKEIIRCLKRYIARELYTILTNQETSPRLP